MKKLFVAAAILSTVILFTGCGGSGGDPKAALTAFFDAMGKKDVEAARKLATADSKSMLDMMEMGLKMAKDKDTKETDKFDKSRMEFGEAKIEGDKATIPVKDKKSGESTNFTLKKEEGKWKVAFDKASIMQMATDKMSEKGGMDSLSHAVDELKNINVDSLKEGIEKGKEALDSASKMLDKMKHN
jgi:delta 1-pyrroline-5-carboxylate dehydrogenase